ncbi:trimeric intracellular cation channel family protein [Pyxidicoccus fallax]|uniref:Trimeric intracellular cation channel family protein n=1 Tax=Pyxidicoccus fallax TaxID=394095 RepID=A0A848LK41_9BACT|nr:TRIC cation channel family protein [Pyxidicoccus fallax]NMO18091.1 trimeric intracellular cation channel family protein [Pyxidicoccus fallax]NPC78597.1 trimeric intracellular cation channel family protein [Pyxidicoccus fallax]
MASFDLTAPTVPEEVISLGTLVVDLLGVFAGSVLGALAAERRKMDLMGFLVLGLVSGVGGGIIRDTLLQAGPPLALVRPSYLVAALVGSFVAFLLDLRKGPGMRVLATLDAVTLGSFAVAGTQRTLEVGLHPGTALLMGVITAAGGGVVRDVLSRQTPALMRAVPGYYATAALAASAVCLALSQAGHPRLALGVGMVVATTLRLVSLRFGWRLPVKRTRGEESRE